MEKVYLMHITSNHDGNECTSTDVFKTFDGALAGLRELKDQIIRRWDEYELEYEIEEDVQKETPFAYWAIRQHGYEFEYYEEINISEYDVH